MMKLTTTTILLAKTIYSSRLGLGLRVVASNGVFLQMSARDGLSFGVVVVVVVVRLSAPIIDIVCGVFGHNFSIIKSITAE